MGFAAAPSDPRSALARLVAGGEERLPLQAALTRLGADAPLAACVLLSLPNALPGPPTPLCLLGIPAFALALLALFGESRVALPGRLGRLVIPVGQLARLMPTGARRAPRLSPRLAAGLCALLSLVVAIPVPGTTLLPALAVVLIGLGTLERDGRLIDAALATAAAGLAGSAAILAGLAFAVGALG